MTPRCGHRAAMRCSQCAFDAVIEPNFVPEPEEIDDKDEGDDE